MSNKCNHEKVCTECVKEEIAVLESKLAELKKKLPPQFNINKILQEFDRKPSLNIYHII